MLCSDLLVEKGSSFLALPGYLISSFNLFYAPFLHSLYLSILSLKNGAGKKKKPIQLFLYLFGVFFSCKRLNCLKHFHLLFPPLRNSRFAASARKAWEINLSLWPSSCSLCFSFWRRRGWSCINSPFPARKRQARLVAWCLRLFLSRQLG